VLGVAGGVLASAFFFIVYEVIAAIQNAERRANDLYFEEIHTKFGVKKIYQKRGDEITGRLYKAKIEKAKSRIWAIGMSNGAFLTQNLDTLRNLLLIGELDVRIAFWDPYLVVKRSAGNLLDPQDEFEFYAMDIQHKLEGNATAQREHWAEEIEGRVKNIFDELGELSAKIHVYLTAIPTNFTCLITDDDIFFFPFLGAMGSWEQPTIHISANTEIGGMIVNHFNALLSERCFATVEAVNK
jgi:hypothetical protein